MRKRGLYLLVFIILASFSYAQVCPPAGSPTHQTLYVQTLKSTIGNCAGSITLESPLLTTLPATFLGGLSASSLSVAGNAVVGGDLTVSGTILGDGSGLTGIATDQFWLASGNKIYNLTANVGIGLSNPLYPLDVNGAMRVGILFDKDILAFYLDPSATSNLNIVNANKFIGDGSGLTGIATDQFWSSNGNKIYNLSANVGIGLSNPQYPLDVNGAMRVGLLIDKDSSAHYLDPSATSNLNIVNANKFIGDGSGLTGIGADQFWSSNGNKIYNLTANVGIGLTDPIYLLDVNGNIRVSLIMDKDSMAHYVDPSGTSKFNNINTDGKIGVGTTSPLVALDVIGAVKIGTDLTVVCTPDTKGTLKFSDTLKSFEYCDGQLFIPIGVADIDLDGVPNAIDCDSTDPGIGKVAVGLCDKDGDGFFDKTAFVEFYGPDCSKMDRYDTVFDNFALGIADDGTCDGDQDGNIDASALTPGYGPVCTYIDPDDNDAALTGINIGSAGDDTCDGDDDSYIDKSAYLDDGKLIGFDLDDNVKDSGPGLGTIVYAPPILHNGNFGGRSGVDDFCQVNMPADLECSNTHAFLSVRTGDTLKDMPTNYGYGGPLYWYNIDTKGLTILDNSWNKMCTVGNSIVTNQINGAGLIQEQSWTGTGDGCSARRSCVGWSTTGGSSTGILGDPYANNERWLEYPHLLYNQIGCVYSKTVRCACTPKRTAGEIQQIWSQTPDSVYIDKSVGIGVVAPVTKLDVAGGIKIGQTSLACDSSTAGAIKYNDLGYLELCNGADWLSVGDGTDSDGDGAVNAVDCDSNSVNVGAAADGTCDGDGDGFMDVTAINALFGPDCTTLDPDDTDSTIGGSNLNSAADGTCDGDDDGYLDISTYAEDGNLRNYDLDDSVAADLQSVGTIVYVTPASANGNFGGRAGLDNFCKANMPSTLDCTNIHAMVSVGISDAIFNMPANYGYDSSMPLYWYHTNDKKLVEFASSWTKACDNTPTSILISQAGGTGNSQTVRTGASPSPGQACDVNIASNSICGSAGGGWTSGTGGGGQIGDPAALGTTWVYRNAPLCSYAYPIRCACTP